MHFGNVSESFELECVQFVELCFYEVHGFYCVGEFGIHYCVVVF